MAKTVTPARDDAKPDTTRETESRVTLPINEKGELDLDRMQGRSKERVREWFANPALAAKLGVVPIATAASTSAHAAPDVLPDALLHSLVNTIGQLSAAVIEKVYGCTPEQATHMHFSTEERDAITPPLRTVLNKYGSTVLLKYGDEIALVAILGSTIANKAGSVQRAMAKQTPAFSIVRPDPENLEPVKID